MRRPSWISLSSPARRPKRWTISEKWPAWLVILVSMFRTRSAGPIKNDTSKPFVAKSRPGKILPCSDSLIDRVGRFQLEEFIGATYLPLARVVEDPDIIREEEGHVDFGTNATAEFAAKGGEHKERIQKAVDYWYAKGLDMFGNSKSYRSERYMFWGLKRRPNAVARQAYKDEIDALILKMGLQLPDPNKGRLYT